MESESDQSNMSSTIDFKWSIYGRLNAIFLHKLSHTDKLISKLVNDFETIKWFRPDRVFPPAKLDHMYLRMGGPNSAESRKRLRNWIAGVSCRFQYLSLSVSGLPLFKRSNTSHMTALNSIGLVVLSFLKISVCTT